jgi:endonuclease/exonuclease/phosphatase family metal-dependent hydrolase
MRRARVAAALLVGAVMLVGAAAASPPRPLRVVSYNLLHGGPALGRDYDGQRLEERLVMATDALRRLAPDLLGVQEASAGPQRGDVASRLADALGFHHVRAAAGYRLLGRLERWWFGFEEGPALLSRYPLRDARAIRVDGGDPWYGRTLLCAVADTPWGPLDACSVHTDGSRAQLRGVARALLHRPRDGPLILTGDLNVAADAPAIVWLRAKMGFVDPLDVADPGRAYPTVWQPVRDAVRRARRRVDYVLVAAPPGGRTRVVDGRIALDQPGRARDGGPLWPSDHYAVVADVEVF